LDDQRTTATTTLVTATKTPTSVMISSLDQEDDLTGLEEMSGVLLVDDGGAGTA
jgi:hypothetical protein